MPVHVIVVLATSPILLLMPLYWHWKVFSLYRSLGDRVSSVGYASFSVQYQTPQLARQLRYPDVLSSLPQDLSARVKATRRQTRYPLLIVPIWALGFVVLLVYQ